MDEGRWLTEYCSRIAAVRNVQIGVFDESDASAGASRADVQQVLVDFLRRDGDGFGADVSVQFDEGVLQRADDVREIALERRVHLLDVLEQIELVDFFRLRAARVLVRIVVRAEKKRREIA